MRLPERGTSVRADAELPGAGRWARADALAVLAAEEWGKTSAAITFSFMPPEAEARIPVRELPEDHRTKMAGALLMRIRQPGHVTCQSAALRWVQPFAVRLGGLRWRRRRPCRCVSRWP
jgi:hypothetical protein